MDSVPCCDRRLRTNEVCLFRRIEKLRNLLSTTDFFGHDMMPRELASNSGVEAVIDEEGSMGPLLVCQYDSGDDHRMILRHCWYD